MENTLNPVLCGGTFLTQILQSRRPTATRRQRTQGVSDSFKESDVLLGLIQIVQPDYIQPAGDTFRTNTTNYKKCKNNIPEDLKFENDEIMMAFLSRIEENYEEELNKATLFANQFIDLGTTAKKDVLLVKRLIEIIRDDKGIPDDCSFIASRSGATISKKDLIDSTEVYLPALLLSVWNFIVINRKDNTIGAATVSKWFPNRKDKYEGINGSTIQQKITVFCDRIETSIVDVSNTDDCVATPEAVSNKFVMPDVYTYLRNADEKYNNIKTLLYNDQPRPFYSFYVCNRIRYREIDCGDENHAGKYQRNIQYLENVTVEKIKSISRFSIIIGTGGLGKSMMMRHFILDAIANFDDLKLFPVFVPLKDFDETEFSLIDYIYNKIVVFDSDLKKDNFEDMLLNGSCLLLLDGLDEIGTSSVKKFERELEAMTDKYSENIFILSSRQFQSFISYERFSLLWLMPFNHRQAMMLIDKLEFRSDETMIKSRFQNALEKTLFRTHRSFTQNPLLLTIMLLTFEQYAEVPSKMHIFYREAFDVLAKRHDASKGSYKRAMKTGLTVDTFADYFAELCFRSYNDEKFEMTADEFDGYFSKLSVRIAVNDTKSSAMDFREDLCSNLCLLYHEGNSYHFTHRSFQEYFCALFLSKQKDKFISKLGGFFEKHQRRMLGDRTFYMLYDMVSDKVEEYILLPFLTSLFNKCDENDGYWTFLEDMYQQITYSSEDEYRYSRRATDPNSFLLSAVLEICEFKVNYRKNSISDLPYYKELEIERIPLNKQLTLFDMNTDENLEKIRDEEFGYICRFNVSEIRQKTEYYNDLLIALNDDGFVLKRQYITSRKYMEEISVKQQDEDDILLELL